MALAGLDIDSLDAVIVSHGHNDHVRGIPVLSRRKKTTVFANESTIAQGRLGGSVEMSSLKRFKTGTRFTIGDLIVEPFPVPHDAADTVGFVVSDGLVRAGFATDLGSVTLEARQGLSDCDVCVIESNHDEEMLKNGPYPAFLKKRVSSAVGHLSNDDAAELIAGIAHRSLLHLVLAHLSEKNNHPNIPPITAARALGHLAPSVQISVGWQDRPDRVITVG